LFAWLGVAAEDAIITPRMAATLWSEEEEKADAHLRTLRGLGLLSARTGGYGIHDLMHDLARKVLTELEAPTTPGDLPGLGLTLQSATQQLLERYRTKTIGNLWHTLSDDGYIHDHLVHHFKRAGLDRELEGLLWEESADEHCGWYQAREHLEQTAGFSADVAQVWSYADDRLSIAAGSEEVRAKAIALQLHCALIMASINSLSAGIPANVLAGAFRFGILALPSALALARQNPDPHGRIDALLALATAEPWLIASRAEAPELFWEAFRSRARELFDEALGAARGINDDGLRAKALVAVARELPWRDERDVLGEAFSSARGIVDPESRARALTALAEQLDEPYLLSEALSAARSIVAAESRAEALASVAGRLPQGEGLSVARGIDDPRWRAEALASVAELLPNLEADAAVAIDIEDPRWRIEALASIAMRLIGEDSQSSVLRAVSERTESVGGFPNQLVSDSAFTPRRGRQGWLFPTIFASALLRLLSWAGCPAIRRPLISK